VNVGVVVEGQAESQALRRIPVKIKAPGRRLTHVAYADMQPWAPPAQIARIAIKKLSIFKAEGVTRFVVLLDSEHSSRCTVQLAQEIKQSLAKLEWPNVHVVVKKFTFENWLIADVAALKKMRTRFRVTKRFEKRVAPNKADNIEDAAGELARLCQGAAYHKRNDPVEIAKRQEPRRIAVNSRSFRRFLRVVGCGRYANQSRDP